MVHHAQPLTTSVTYAAEDLMWLDGLDELRELSSGSTAIQDASACATYAQAAPQSWVCSDTEMLQWYCAWLGLPADAHFTVAPAVSTSELLSQLGVPQSQLEPMITKLTTDSLSRLRQMVLPAYWNSAVVLMDEQLPGLGLVGKLSNRSMTMR